MKPRVPDLAREPLGHAQYQTNKIEKNNNQTLTLKSMSCWKLQVAKISTTRAFKAEVRSELEHLFK